jgi:hypothetical protein
VCERESRGKHNTGWLVNNWCASFSDTCFWFYSCQPNNKWWNNINSISLCTAVWEFVLCLVNHWHTWTRRKDIRDVFRDSAVSLYCPCLLLKWYIFEHIIFIHSAVPTTSALHEFYSHRHAWCMISTVYLLPSQCPLNASLIYLSSSCSPLVLPVMSTVMMSWTRLIPPKLHITSHHITSHHGKCTFFLLVPLKFHIESTSFRSKLANKY